MNLSQEILKMVPVLQYRWSINSKGNTASIVYNGIAQMLNQKTSVMVSSEVEKVISAFDGVKTMEEIFGSLSGQMDMAAAALTLQELADNGIIVDIKGQKAPVARENAQTCTKCVNNNYVIPDLEFDENGLCTMCQNYEKAKDKFNDDGKSFTDKEIMSYVAGNTSRFDAMVLFTGGKDSTYLLWHLAKKLGLRVLAATWNMPFMQDAARQNIRSAMKMLPNVEFIEKTVRWDEIKEALRLNFVFGGLPCLCPFMSYLLFYPVAVQEGIPLFVDGVEKVQTLINKSQFMGFDQAISTEQLDRENTVAEITVKVIRYIKKLQKPSVKNRNIESNIQQLSFLRDFERIIPIINDRNSKLPIIKHLANTNFYSTWDEMVDIIKKEMDWKMPEGQDSYLHTSCQIEEVKDYCQFKMYRNAVTSDVPQSMTEISGAVAFGFITRESGLKELEDRGYYGEPDCMKEVLEALEISEEEKLTEDSKIKSIFKGRF